MTVETVTPPPGDFDRRARILALADAMRGEERVAALTLTDRTTAADADPLALAPEVTTRSGRRALVHLAGKARTPAEIERTLAGAAEATVTSVLLTGGDAPPGAPGVDALDLLATAGRVAPGLFRAAVLGPVSAAGQERAWRRTMAKREAGAQVFIAQVTWDLAQRETVSAWQARLGVPVLGAVVLLTRPTLAFLDRHEFTGLAVPPPLRRRVASQETDTAARRLALDIAALRRLGYAGAHVSGVATPELLRRVLDEADGLDATLDEAWRDAWRAAVGIA